MRSTQFKLESLGCETFDGFTKGETRNGWNCPYFIFEQAEKVLKNFNELRQIIGQKSIAFYESSADAFVFPFADGESESFSSVVEDGQNYYPIGTFCWIWEKIENE